MNQVDLQFSDWIFSRARTGSEVLPLWWFNKGRGAGTTDKEELIQQTFKTRHTNPLRSTTITERNRYLQTSHSPDLQHQASIHPSLSHRSSLLPTLSLWSPTSPPQISHLRKKKTPTCSSPRFSLSIHSLLQPHVSTHTHTHVHVFARGIKRQHLKAPSKPGHLLTPPLPILTLAELKTHCSGNLHAL